MTDEYTLRYDKKIRDLKALLRKETQRRVWYERMYNLAIGEVGRWRTQDSLRRQNSD